jgi:hypothetical protein
MSTHNTGLIDRARSLLQSCEFTQAAGEFTQAGEDWTSKFALVRLITSDSGFTDSLANIREFIERVSPVVCLFETAGVKASELLQYLGNRKVKSSSRADYMNL